MLRSVRSQKKRRWLLRAINFWPPFWGAGIRLVQLHPEFLEARVEARLRFWNKNYVGVHFGGAIFSMADPWFMLLLMEQLGKGFVVWDKAATIRFKKPGKGRIHGIFKISPEETHRIRQEALTHGRAQPVFSAQILDEEGEVVAEIEKTVSVKLKKDSL
jgi:acyl-coenzyme A thioesterase PaaI-like protein